jgi:hypothetical protein
MAPEQAKGKPVDKRAGIWAFGSGNELKIEPFSGDSYEFHVEGPGLPESAYKIAGDRIGAARAR